MDPEGARAGRLINAIDLVLKGGDDLVLLAQLESGGGELLSHGAVFDTQVSKACCIASILLEICMMLVLSAAN